MIACYMFAPRNTITRKVPFHPAWGTTDRREEIHFFSTSEFWRIEFINAMRDHHQHVGFYRSERTRELIWFRPGFTPARCGIVDSWLHLESIPLFSRERIERDLLWRTGNRWLAAAYTGQKTLSALRGL